MTKKIMTLAVAFATIFAGSAFAQDNGALKKGARGGAQIECKKECKKGKKECDRKGDFKRGERKCGKDSARVCNPFEGLNLTADQQSKLKAIPTPKAVMKAARKDKLENGTNPRDFVRTVRRDYLSEVKQVLTADQYVQFLENNYVNQAGKQKQGMKAPNGKKGGKGQKAFEGQNAHNRQNPKRQK